MIKTPDQNSGRYKVVYKGLAQMNNRGLQAIIKFVKDGGEMLLNGGIYEKICPGNVGKT